MVGHVAAGTVDAFGVVVERPTHVDEDEHRRVAAVRCGEVVDGGYRVAGARPVRRGVELAGDHHDHRQLGRIRGEPRRREIHELGAVFEVRCVVGDGHRNERPVRGSALAPHRHDAGQIGLVGQRACGQLVPGGLNRREVADPEVQRHPRTEQAQRHRHQRYHPAPPAAAAPTEHRDGQRETGEADPYPERRRCGISREALRIDVPVRPCRQDQADDERHRQPHQSPASRPPTDRHHQHHRGHGLHRRRQPPV